MTTGIICASDDELAPFLSFMEEFSVVRKSMLKIYRGKIAGRSVAALYGGVGKINAAAATQLLTDKFRCDAIINAGTAGALSDALKPFDTVAVVKTACYDADEDLITQYHPFLPYGSAPTKSLLSAQKKPRKLFSLESVFRRGCNRRPFYLRRPNATRLGAHIQRSVRRHGKRRRSSGVPRQQNSVYRGAHDKRLRRRRIEKSF